MLTISSILFFIILNISNSGLPVLNVINFTKSVSISSSYKPNNNFQTEKKKVKRDIPLLSFDYTSNTCNIGQVAQGKVVERYLTLRNNSDKLILIDEILPSCGCYLISLSNNSIEAGKTAEAKIEFHSGFKLGKIKKDIIFKISKPHSEKFIFWLTAEVKAKVFSKPISLNFGELTETNFKKKLSVKLTGPKISSFSIEKIEKTSDLLVVQVNDLGNGGEKKVDIYFRSLPFPGAFRAKVDFISKSSDRKITVFVIAYVAGKVRIKPDLLVLKTTSNNPNPEQKVLIQNPRFKNFKILKVSQVSSEEYKEDIATRSASYSNQKAFIFEIINKKGKGKSIISVKLRRSIKSEERFVGRLKLVTNDKKQKELFLPFYCFALREKE